MADERTHDILVDFNPLRITLPGTGPFAGKIRIVLPEVHLKLWDLSMGTDLLGGAHIGSDARAWSVDFDAPEPGIKAGELAQFVADCEPQLREMHRIIQEEMDKRFLMEGK